MNQIVFSKLFQRDHGLLTPIEPAIRRDTS